MDPSEVEFLAEKEVVEVVPNFSHAVMYLIQGDVGPFKPGIPVSVPLWLASSLKQRQRCRLLQPAWMDLEKLEELRDQERESDLFTELPAPHIFVVANLILDVATQDINKADDIRTVLKDIWDIRQLRHMTQAKLRKSVDKFIQGGFLQAKLNHLQLVELNTVRPLLPHAYDQLTRLGQSTAAARRIQQSANNTTNRSFYAST